MSIIENDVNVLGAQLASCIKVRKNLEKIANDCDTLTLFVQAAQEVCTQHIIYCDAIEQALNYITSIRLLAHRYHEEPSPFTELDRKLCKAVADNLTFLKGFESVDQILVANEALERKDIWKDLNNLLHEASRLFNLDTMTMQDAVNHYPVNRM